MKPRVQVDTLFMVTAILTTGVLYFFPHIYQPNSVVSNILSFFGFISIYKGTALRMSARGHKKAFSAKSENLVTTGPYKVVRNPMYLGSFLIGAGFVLILWPWWGVPLFAWLFYTRFKRQVFFEEEMLGRAFGSKYTAYCHLTPRIFPNIYAVSHVRTRDMFDLQESFSTKEKFGLLSWPALALLFAYFQRVVLYKQTNFNELMVTFVVASIVFVIGFVVAYWVK